MNIGYENGFRIAKEIGAGGRRGLFHSNKMRYPMKYAYPSPVCDNVGLASPDEQWYISMVEIVVNPLKKCKNRQWHFTPNDDIVSSVRLKSVLVAMYDGPRDERYLKNKSGHIKMAHGVPIPTLL